MIRWAKEPLLGVPVIPECLVVEWTQDGKRVVFSFAQMGKGITMHFAAQTQSLRVLKQAVNDFVEWLFWAYDWCEMVFGVIGRRSIEKLMIKCGFTRLGEQHGYQIYVRGKV